MSEPKYTKLLKVNDYDHDVVDELAEALNDLAALQKRATELDALVQDNAALFPHLWRTADGSVYAIHNLEDEHLVNILQYIVNKGDAVKKELRAEAMKRGIEVPTRARMTEPADNKRLRLADGMEVQQ